MKRRSIWLLGLLTGLGAAMLWWHNAGDGDPTRLASPSDTDPRLTFDTPYRNVHPDVQYVGDAACARCHADVAHSYAGHPMGRSLAPALDEPPELATAMENPFTDAAGEYRYRIEQRDGRLWHSEERLSADGEVLFTTMHAATYAVGSGQHGRSYLIDRDGWLFLSPITWYPQKQRWDLSPGYEARNQHFTRPITTECLFCHTNFADHVPETVNRYRPPIFRGHAIGCERCHGPGQLHVARHEAGEKVSGIFDGTIVNPQDLEPALRDAICQQCHLGGDVRIARQNLDLYDFRPGLPWHRFAAVYVKAPHLRLEATITGHVEQMHASRCWQASAAKLGCISCHDAHTSPAVNDRPAFYRSRCLKCHVADSCSGDEAARTTTSPPDHCVHCHMPSIGTQVRHAAITDHRVPRRAEAESAMPTEDQGLPLLLFHRDLVDAREPQSLRDLGVALVRLSDEDASLVTSANLDTAISLLEAAVRNDPQDWDAIEALAHAVGSQGQRERSLALFQQVLDSRPQRELSLYSAASRAQQLKRYDLAIELWRRTIAVNPWTQRPYQSLALALGEQRDWTGAAAAARRALDLFPGDSRSRQLLVECHLWLGDAASADSEFVTLLRLEPEKSEALRRWYDGHPGRRGKP
jgi:Flp pilus assembly protein TadD